MGGRLCSECNKIKNVSEFKICYRRKGKPYSVKFCKDCMRERYRNTKKEWNSKNPEKVLGQQRRARAKNGSILRQRVKEYHQKNPDKVTMTLERNRFRRALYSSRKKAEKRGYVSCTATIEELTEAFTGKCFICDKTEEENGKRLCLDHSHLTGDFRGFLCNDCNFAIGNLKDSSAIVMKLYEYLQKNKE